jgi:hypothetical protein
MRLASPVLQVPAAIASNLDAASQAGHAAVTRFQNEHPSGDDWLFRSFVVQAGGYAPGSEVEQTELATIRELQAQRTPEGIAEVVRLDKAGAGSLWRDLIASSGLSEAVRGQALLTLETAFTFANDVAQTVKGASMRQRPFVVDPTIVPVGHVPGNNPSYPSGHATAAYAAAEVLAAVLPARRAEFERLAGEVAFSRLYGGMHFPSDVVAGARIGVMVGSFLGARIALAGAPAAGVLSRR